MSVLQISPLPVPPVAPEGSAETTLLAVLAVMTLSIVALVAAGVTYLHRLRMSHATALQTRVVEAIAGDVDCARVDVVTTVGPSAAAPVTVTLEGIIASSAARQRAIRRAQAAARDVDARVTVIDRLTVQADRAA